MTNFFEVLIKNLFKVGVGIWDFIFFFFGFTYEKQADKLDLDEMDPMIRGPENQKTGHQFYRANKVGKKS